MTEQELILKQSNLVNKVAKTYHSLLRKSNCFPSYNQELSFYDSISNACTEHLPTEKFILAVETSYFALKHHLRKIIKCDYFYKNFPFWWQNLYSRRQYYRYRVEAVEKFLHNLERTKAITKDGRINYEKH